MKDITRYTSIIIASFIPNEMRAKMFLTSLDSLIESVKHLPVEIIVVDNGGSSYISQCLDELVASGSIQCVVHNATNMHFGFARNQGIALSHGSYLCITDNDILYEAGWLDKCLEILENYPQKKIYATPIDYPTDGLRQKYHQGELALQGDTYKLSMRAGSNCFVIRRKDFEVIGKFLHHRIAGTIWTDQAVKQGYLAAVTPVNMVKDLGLRQGYNLSEALPIKITLTNGEEVYFNHDEFTV